jgi:hypothetical protein
MRGEKKMIDAVFVYDAIGKVVSRFKKSQLHTARHYYEVECEDGEPYEVHFYIEDEIKTMLDGLNIKNDVRLIDMHRATGFDVYVLAIAFVIDEELFTIDFTVEGDCY